MQPRPVTCVVQVSDFTYLPLSSPIFPYLPLSSPIGPVLIRRALVLVSFSYHRSWSILPSAPLDLSRCH
jgi:hypothetical protein